MHAALGKFRRKGRGPVYMRPGGRAIGSRQKIRYNCRRKESEKVGQTGGWDPSMCEDYGLGAQILSISECVAFPFSDEQTRMKVVGLEGYVPGMVEQCQYVAKPIRQNGEYLETQRRSWDILL